ncbi:MAG: UDP-N-acetylmuramoyl-tripeptide--D-alanyl-D-alanine ligase [Thiomicrospira sp.]|uniref:UDP-N-acetylmuramoyl-tripeptide--D-alanyl-D- alanine ligase n=1 Tax=Thiomicrospira sp. TaxID=935 RepID=UPI001A01F746|nr:UDP-N-acetylmuramoyl-tripeptide--D-alanyl-D-alanine ligase [Thiomicrospira sp.]MBE0493101.1 UDP-N-acetylmuramoyl-tripeptide--D-alanyl-D-alanine ligase [Thiomicrospira sp.]
MASIITENPNHQAWSLARLAEWTQAKLIDATGDANQRVCMGVSTDSRSTRPGDCYIAIKGERFDGHAFIDQAIKQGAVVLLVSEPGDYAVPSLLVDDTRIALGLMANGHRQSQHLNRLIAVTGSNGKTTVKTLLAHILQTQAPTWATPGNLNNDFGVPRTLLQISAQHRYAVIEMGANHIGEIDYLTRIAQPDVALITLAAEAHLEGFGSLQGVIDTKGEIFNGLSDQGVGVINTDSPGFEQWRNQLAGKKIMTFGRAEQADIRIKNGQSNPKGIEFELVIKNQVHSVNMPIMGLHNAMNAAAACAVCLAIGLSWPQIQPGLESFQGVAGRLQTYQSAQGLLIDDSYNANPSSVKAAIDTLAALPGKTVLCLGAMAELGSGSQDAHIQVGDYARQQGVDYVFGFGEATQATLTAFNASPSQPLSHAEMTDQVQQLINTHQPIDILIKGSRSAQMERVVEAILERNQYARLS